ncbi:B-box zinc finger protein [Sinorhizobium meliloti]
MGSSFATHATSSGSHRNSHRSVFCMQCGRILCSSCLQYT